MELMERLGFTSGSEGRPKGVRGGSNVFILSGDIEKLRLDYLSKNILIWRRPSFFIGILFPMDGETVGSLDH